MSRPSTSLPLLTACWLLAGGLPEAAAAPPLRLAVTTPVAGDRTLLRVQGATPGATVRLVLGDRAGAGPCPAVLGTCLGVAGARSLGTVTVDAAGVGTREIDVPASVAVGTRVAFQAVEAGTTSNVVERRVSAPVELLGVWVDEFGFEHELDDRAWIEVATSEVLAFSNVGRRALVRNGPDTFFPGRFSRIDWTVQGAATWYCQAAYDALTAADALAVVSDASDPAHGGCGGFPWSRLVPGMLDLDGTWVDGWGTTNTIDEGLWDQGFGAFHVTRWSNARRFVVARNDDANAFFPGAWSRFDWTERGGDLWYCQSVYDGATETAALYATPADPTDPASGGCGGAWPGGFAWTLLTP